MDTAWFVEMWHNHGCWPHQVSHEYLLLQIRDEPTPRIWPINWIFYQFRKSTNVPIIRNQNMADLEPSLMYWPNYSMHIIVFFCYDWWFQWSDRKIDQFVLIDNQNQIGKFLIEWIGLKIGSGRICILKDRIGKNSEIRHFRLDTY